LQAVTQSFYVGLFAGPTEEEGFGALTWRKRLQLGDFLGGEIAGGDFVAGDIGTNVFDIHAEVAADGEGEQGQSVRMRNIEGDGRVRRLEEQIGFTARLIGELQIGGRTT